MRALAAWLSFALVSTYCGSAAAADMEAAYRKLDELTHGMQSLQTDFTQVLSDDHGRVLDKSTGTLSVLKPGRFRWNYATPHPQEIVSDGEKLWIFDKDLEQVTQRPLDESLAGTPAILLSGEGSLRDSFEVTQMQEKGSQLALTLKPKRNDTDFRAVQLLFEGNVLKSMELADKLGQVSTVEFSNFKRNPKLDATLFNFVPPPGADVIGGPGAVKQP
jgi:outer membrane lipoprotein carrier protein